MPINTSTEAVGSDSACFVFSHFIEMNPNKIYRLYINNESVKRVVCVQATDTLGLFENRTAYYQGEKLGRKWVGCWLRWKTPAEKVTRKLGTKSIELVQKAGRRQMNFFIDEIYADRLPTGSLATG